MSSTLELQNPTFPTAVVAGGLSLLDYGAKADAVKLLDGAIGAGGSTALQLPTAALTSADVGKPIAVEACGAGLTAKAKMTSGSNALTLTWLTVRVTAGSGTWDYTHAALGTAAGLAWNITAPALVTALEALYGAGKVSVTLSGTTYTITLLSGAASTDTTQVTTSAAGLSPVLNGPAAAALVTYQVWSYADVGKRIHVPGAGAAGGVLTAWIGSIEPTTSNVAYLVTTPPVIFSGLVLPAGAPANSSATLVTDYFTLNWLRTTILSVTDATHLVLAAPVDAGVQVALTGLEVHYGSDNTTPLTNAILDARTKQKPLSLGAGVYLCTAGQLSQHANGLTMYGAGQDATTIRCIPTDAEAESGRLFIGGTADTQTGRATGVSLRNFRWNVPTAHTRGSGTVAGSPNNKTFAAGLLLFAVNYFSIFDVCMDNNYGVGFNLQNVSHGLVSFCRALGSWADSFNVNNANSSGSTTTPGITDVTFYGCTAQASGDDMFTTNYYVANGPRMTAVSFLDCHGYYQRQLASGRGVSLVGGDDLVVGDCTMTGTNGASYDLAGSNAKNALNTPTVSTPGTGAVVTFLAAPANLIAGTTQMRLFKNDGSGTTWIGDVASIGGAGTIATLTAAAGQLATCPFTGVGLVQWGANTDGFRFGIGGCSHVTMSNILSESANLNPAGDGTLNGSLRLNAGQATTEGIRDVQIDGIVLNNCYQSGILVNSQYTATVSDAATADKLLGDVKIEGISINTTGLSSLTSTRPWPGIYLRHASNVTLRGKVTDSADGALLVFNPGVAGRIRVDLEGVDIGRIPQAGVPQVNAFDFGTNAGVKAIVDRVYLSNPSGTAGGTKYVCTNVLSQPTTGSTIHVVDSDIAGQNLLVETAARYSIVISPVFYRGKGTPEGVVTAPVGAMYERSDGGSGTALYVKETGAGNTGWVAYAAPGGSPAPELDMVYGTDPLMTYAGAVWGLANRCYVVRARGNGSISNINFTVKVQSGNVQACVYANTGIGRNARPTGAALQASALIACPAVGTGVIPLAAAQTITHLGHWLAILADNITISSDRVSATAGDGSGFAHSYDASAAAVETIGVHALAASGAYVPFLFGT